MYSDITAYSNVCGMLSTPNNNKRSKGAAEAAPMLNYLLTRNFTANVTSIACQDFVRNPVYC